MEDCHVKATFCTAVVLLLLFLKSTSAFLAKTKLHVVVSVSAPNPTSCRSDFIVKTNVEEGTHA